MIAALDVESLYPNIDHEEGATACKYYLNQRYNQHIQIATKVLKHLTLLILRMITMMFCGIFTAMGTPMAVNYANSFMGLKINLLHDYKKN